MIRGALLLLTFPVALVAQMPPSERLSPKDDKEFHAEIDRLNHLLAVSSDRCTVMYQIARTWAAGGQYPEAIEWLGKVVAMNAGFDPSRDPMFTKLQGTVEYERLVEKARASTPPVSHSSKAFEIPVSDQFPENLAWDPQTNQFFFGSTHNGTILRCNIAGSCQTFARDTGIVFGLKVDGGRRVLWAASNRDGESALICYRLGSGVVFRKCAWNGPGHSLNDLAIDAAGDVFVTDTAAAAVFRVRHAGTEIERIAPGKEFIAANGITLSADGTKLYVADFGDGITVVDVPSGAVHAIAHPAGVCLGYIDGLYWYRGRLIAIQNGYMSPRVVRFALTADGNGIVSMEVLERRDPLFDGVTTGVIAGREFFYMANNQIDKAHNAHLDPITILKIDLN